MERTGSRIGSRLAAATVAALVLGSAAVTVSGCNRAGAAGKEDGGLRQGFQHAGEKPLSEKSRKALDEYMKRQAGGGRGSAAAPPAAPPARAK